MYLISKIEDTVRIPPSRFDEPLNEVASEIINESYMGQIDKKMGLMVTVKDVEEIGVGKVIMGDGAAYHGFLKEMTAHLRAYFRRRLRGLPDEVEDPGDGPDAPRARLRPIQGMPPSLAKVPPGCAFAPRCPSAIDVCHREAPPLRLVKGPRLVVLAGDEDRAAHVVRCWVEDAEAVRAQVPPDAGSSAAASGERAP